MGNKSIFLYIDYKLCLLNFLSPFLYLILGVKNFVANIDI